jgi:hypothetical protein
MSRASSRVFFERGLQGLWAYGIRFDKDSNVIAETESRLFIGYSRAEIRQLVRAELTGGVK